MPTAVNGVQQASRDPDQPILRSPLETTSKGKGSGAPAGHDTNIHPDNASAAAGNGNRMGGSSVAADPSILKHGSFQSKLIDLYRLLVVRQGVDLDPPQAFDHIIRMQIETLPATVMENRESSVTKYVEGLGIIWNFIRTQWNPMEHDGWNEDRNYVAQRIPQIMAELMLVLDVQNNSILIRDVDPLTALESLTRTKHKLLDKHGLKEQVQNLIKQRIRAVCFAQHHYLEMVGAVDLARAEPMPVHKAREDPQSQTINLKEQLDQAESESLQHSPDSFRAIPSDPIPLSPLTPKPSDADSLSSPSEGHHSGPPVAGFGPHPRTIPGYAATGPHRAGFSRFCSDHMPQASYTRAGYSGGHKQQNQANQGARRRGRKRDGYRSRDRYTQGGRRGKPHNGGHGYDMSHRDMYL